MWVDFAHLSKKQRDHNANDIRQLVNAGAGTQVRAGAKYVLSPPKKSGFNPAPFLLSNPVLRAILRA
jgi:hypothetical protein